MATNSCPPEKDPCDIVTNGVGWCESLNKYGLKAHFDIAKGAAAAQINGWGELRFCKLPCHNHLTRAPSLIGSLNLPANLICYLRGLIGV